MSNNYHTAIALGAAAAPATFNTPLGLLDQAIKAIDDRVDTLILDGGASEPEVVDARGGFALLADRLDAGTYHPLNHSCAGDGATDDAAAMFDLASGLPAAGGTILVDRAYRLGANQTFPAKAAFLFLAGGSFAVDTGVTITVNGPVSADPVQIFSLTGTGKVVLGGTKVVLPQWWGAVADGVVDCRTAIAAAIAAPTVGVVHLRAGTYRLSAAASELILINRAIPLEGEGHLQTVLAPDNGIAGTVDVIRVDIPGQAYNLRLQNFGIIPAAGTPCRHGIHLDVTDAGQQLRAPKISNVYVAPLGGRAIYLTNPTNPDSFFFARIADNAYLAGGCYFQRLGDSNWIERNSIGGANIGIEIETVIGSLQNVIRDNNITNAGGAIRATEARCLKILHNQIEQSGAYTGADDACVSIEGISTRLAFGVEIVGNSIQPHPESATGVDYAVRVNYGRRVLIANNRLQIGAAGHINLTANARDTIIGENYYDNGTYTQVKPTVTDAGVGTMGLLKAATLENSWVNRAADWTPPGYIKLPGGLVVLRGNIKDGTTTGGTVLLTLPLGFRPQLNTVLLAPCYQSGVGIATAWIQIGSNGAVSLLNGHNAWLSLEGLAFYTNELTA